jgi:hypothetical protein
MHDFLIEEWRSITATECLSLTWAWVLLIDAEAIPIVDITKVSQRADLHRKL